MKFDRTLHSAAAAGQTALPGQENIGLIFLKHRTLKIVSVDHLAGTLFLIH